MLTREQVRAARAVRGWTAKDLAEAVRTDGAGPLSPITISRFENGADSRGETLRRIQTALEREGFEFLNSSLPGIRWRADALERWAKGQE
ncbi:helix-turn-helix domain-containing protein [Azospirillum brasilense]|uniref:helix-turn-helix domain-containing protein n=1 Tax=Azospirillum brasilense TaxID=192 RepID=UPI0011A98BF9|nr:helix-turn-helix transcriptional regulator [Azospirillum brasilense]